MRISDWSSDVCSSDLHAAAGARGVAGNRHRRGGRQHRGSLAMDLGIRGRKALVCAASKGLGRACAFSLAKEGVDGPIVARTRAPLEKTAEEISAARGVTVTAGAPGITPPAGRRRALEAPTQPAPLAQHPARPPPGT